MTDETIDQAPEQSIDDKIASKFGFPGSNTEEASASEAAPEESDLVELEWDAAVYKVPKTLKEAFMRHEDYTRKTQELAEQRRSLDHVRELSQSTALERAFNDSISEESREISVIDAYLQQMGKQDWSQMSTDQILRQKIELDNIKERKSMLQEAIAQKRDKFNGEVKAKIDSLRKAAREQVKATDDMEKGLRDYARQYGFSDTELDNVLLDPRSFRILMDASQFKQVQSQAAKPAQKPEKILKPGAATDHMPKSKADDLNFRKAMKGARTSGEKASVIEQRLMNRFG